MRETSPLRFSILILIVILTLGASSCVPSIGMSLIPTRRTTISSEAAVQGGLMLEVRAGFDGYYKVNSWVPVQVIVANQGQDIEGEIQLLLPGSLSRRGTQTSGRTLSAYTQQAIMPTHSRKQFTLYTFVENYDRELTVRLVEKVKRPRTGRVLAEQTISIEPLAAEDFLYGIVSDDLSALNYLAGLTPTGQRPGTGHVHVAHLKLSDLPSQGRALGSVDVLILHNTDTSPLDNSDKGQQQRDALRSWVAFGGHLIICGGPNAIPTAAGLGDLLPVQINGTLTTADVGTLGDFAGTPFLVNVPAVISDVSVVIAQVEPTTGNGPPPARIMAGKADLPLLIRRDLDRGRIDYLALDPDLEPMRTWIGNETLWAKILFPTPLGRTLLASKRPGNAGGLSSSGVISWGSFDSALSNIPRLDLPSVLLVMAFLFLYIVIVGPLNFLILKLIDKRALAWISVPVLILLSANMFACCIAYAIGFVSRGHKAIVSEITIVRAQPESKTAGVDTFVGLYSPARQSYDLRLPNNVLVRPLVTSSIGPRTYFVSGGKLLKVEQGPPTYLRKFDVDMGTMRGFATHSIRPWHGIEANLTLVRTATNAYHVEGTISNRSSANIQNCVLVLNSQPIKIADLAAGATETISIDFHSTGSISFRHVLDSLAGPYATGSKGRERERKRTILDNILSPGRTLSAYNYRGGGPSSPVVQLDGLNLLGWLDASPDEISVQGQEGGRRVPHSLTATTLLIAQLSVKWMSAGQDVSASVDHSDVLCPPIISAVPKGSMNWQLVDGEPGTTPCEHVRHALYSHQPATTFLFYLPHPQDIEVEKLILHVNTLDQSPYGNLPVIYIKRWQPQDGNWESSISEAAFTDLAWGENELSNPHQFIREDGGIEIKVSTKTIQAPISVDFSAIGK